MDIHPHSEPKNNKFFKGLCLVVMFLLGWISASLLESLTTTTLKFVVEDELQEKTLELKEDTTEEM